MYERITWQEAEQLMGARVDRRQAFYSTPDRQPDKDCPYFPRALVFTYGEWTQHCTGCCEVPENTHAPAAGSGCEECGYTGKRRQGMFAPYMLDGEKF